MDEQSGPANIALSKKKVIHDVTVGAEEKECEFQKEYTGGAVCSSG
jgi:hypothetical protein